MAISLGPSGLNINGTIVDGPEDLGSPTTFGSVGTYAFAVTRNTTQITAGNTRSGSQLEYITQADDGAMWKFSIGSESATAMTSGAGWTNWTRTTLSGTWRNMGPATSTTQQSNNRCSINLWCRTA